MRIKIQLIVASFKMFVRQREALIWTLVLPLFMVFLFSFVKFDGLGTIPLGIVSSSGDTSLAHSLRTIKTFKVFEGEVSHEINALKKGDRSMVIVIPEKYQTTSRDSLILYLNAERPQDTQVGKLIIQRVLDEMVFQQNSNITAPLLRVETVNSRNLTYIDFILPGVLAMAIMQNGVFGVAFGFVLMKKRGVLRRLLVTPIKTEDFIIGQVAARLLVLLLQIFIMIGAGTLFLHLHFIGSMLDLIIVGLLGGIVFLSLGFALSGLSKSEDQVAPLANIVTLPMMLLSGVFFSRTNLPGFAHTITNFFPLTYLADGMRNIAIEGATLGDVLPQILGLAVWGVVMIVVAVKAFRWE